jgi:hypothetical protein
LFLYGKHFTDFPMKNQVPALEKGLDRPKFDLIPSFDNPAS